MRATRAGAEAGTGYRHEHRKAQRFPIEQPVRLAFTRAGHYELEAVSKDVSTRGVFVYVESEIVEGSEVQLRLNVPAEGGIIVGTEIELPLSLPTDVNEGAY